MIEQVRYYTDVFADDAAARLPSAIEEAAAFLARNPRAGAPRFTSSRRLVGLRAWPVPGFEDVRIYYLHNRRTLRIIRVLHGKRDTAKILSRGGR